MIDVGVHVQGEPERLDATLRSLLRYGPGGVRTVVLLDEGLGSLYEAVIECTEEAIVNSLCMAGDMTGQGGNYAPGLPLDRVVELMRKYRPERR